MIHPSPRRGDGIDTETADAPGPGLHVRDDDDRAAGPVLRDPVSLRDRPAADPVDDPLGMVRGIGRRVIGPRVAVVRPFRIRRDRGGTGDPRADLDPGAGGRGDRRREAAQDAALPAGQSIDRAGDRAGQAAGADALRGGAAGRQLPRDESAGPDGRRRPDAGPGVLRGAAEYRVVPGHAVDLGLDDRPPAARGAVRHVRAGAALADRAAGPQEWHVNRLVPGR